MYFSTVLTVLCIARYYYCQMKVENAKAQMRKGVLEFCILNILKNKEAYPSEIIEELRAAKLTVVEGTIYPLLTRLKNSGVLEYRWVESKSGIIKRSNNIN